MTAIDMIPDRELSGTELRALIDLATNNASEIFDPPPLVTGRDLQRELGLASGPRLGQILAEIRRLQIEGTVTTRRQALGLASELTLDSERGLDGRAPSDRS